MMPYVYRSQDVYRVFTTESLFYTLLIVVPGYAACRCIGGLGGATYIPKLHQFIFLRFLSDILKSKFVHVQYKILSEMLLLK
jgi:hypothetical protein